MITTPMRGFTLVETLVAITIVVTAMVGPLYAVQQSLNASRTAREQLIASSLAQEGIEYVRGKRDNNYLYLFMYPVSGRSWLFGVDGTGGSVNCISAPCVVDATQNTQSRTILPLYLDLSGLYNQASSGTITPYTRTVQLSAVSGNTTEMLVTVTVTWTTKGQQRNVTIREYLHNWL
ncbi:MAG: prepilin-type N-terminal cleavage/methylation domain-containing protein [Patescibacteria group bacterium]